MRRVALRCIGVDKSFDGVPAVQALDLNVASGTILALVGPSGCGKTTTLRLIAGFERPDSGAIVLGGQIIAGRGVYMPPEKRRVGMVFQEYALFPHLRVAENVAFGLPRGAGREERVRELLDLVGLVGLERRSPHELSGGEQQRVALARALAPRPEVLLLDEPFSNLHANLRAQVRQEVREVLRASGTTAILVTHDQEEALFMGDLVAVQRQGRLEQVDTPERIFHAPATHFVAGFMGTAHFFPLGRHDSLPPHKAAVSPRGALGEGGEVEVMVRPDDLVIELAEGGNGRIAARVFQGASYVYQVGLDSGVTLHCSMPHTERYPVGTRVAVRLNPAHPPLCFVNGRSTGPASQDLIGLVRERFLPSVS